MTSQYKRIGFACKYMHEDQTQKKKLLEEIQRPLNTRSTTVAWLNRQTREVAEQRLWDIMVHNIQSYYNLIEYVGSLPNELRMVRLGSDGFSCHIRSLGIDCSDRSSQFCYFAWSQLAPRAGRPLI